MVKIDHLLRIASTIIKIYAKPSPKMLKFYFVRELTVSRQTALVISGLRSDNEKDRPALLPMSVFDVDLSLSFYFL